MAKARTFAAFIPGANGPVLIWRSSPSRVYQSVTPTGRFATFHNDKRGVVRAFEITAEQKKTLSLARPVARQKGGYPDDSFVTRDECPADLWADFTVLQTSAKAEG